MRTQKKIIKIIGCSIVGCILLFSIISMVITIVVYSRQFPRYERHDMSVSAGLRYEDLREQYPRRLVSFKSGTNRLQGYVYGMNQAKGLVVVVHGLGGGADSYLSQITYFVDQGWRVFAYDATGSFDSEGHSTKGFPQALIDLDAALMYIESQEDFATLPILLFGHSWGGYAVANILHYDYNIAGIVSISGTNSPMEIIIEQGRSMMGSFIYTQYPYLWLYQRLLFGKTASLKASDAILQSDVPVLIIHGTNDESVAYDGSSIISHFVKRPVDNVITLSISDEGRNGHNNLFRSHSAIDYIDNINVEYGKLYQKYDQNIPYNIKQEFYSKIDRALAQDVNKDMMDKIHLFFIDAIKKIEQ